MKYTGQPNFEHGTPEKMGVLLVNLGTPQAPQTQPVRRYLHEFLSDPRIIEMPRLLRMILLHGLILRIRPPNSAKAYQKVWSEQDGSPLLSNSNKQLSALSKDLQSRFAGNVVVALGMRYGEPSIDRALRELEQQHVRRLIVLPLYPQYSATTTASVFDAVTTRLQRTRWIPELRFINQYCDEPGYIEALAASVQRSWDHHGKGQLLITSYHGIPRQYLVNGDPYFCLCHKTSRLLAEALNIDSKNIKVVFQSRVGRKEWLRPYCDETMKQLPGNGTKSIDVLSPAFSADCLETIEEIDVENREFFIHNGGERFQYIPCLNDDPAHIRFLGDLVARHAQGWPEADMSRTSTEQLNQNQATAMRAANLKKTESTNSLAD